MRKTLHKEIFINASREKVWKTMLEDATYRQWTRSFNPSSYYKGNWEQGSKILFLGTNPVDGKEGGMISRIKENRLHEFISIEHLGIMNDGKEDTESDFVKDWKGAHENYTFKDENGGTRVLVDVDLTEEAISEMEGMWDKALEALKELAEK
jgi:hypothetical protein